MRKLPELAAQVNDPAGPRDNDPDDRRYRIEIPNLIDDLGLTVYALRLYLHIKRRAGSSDSGVCFEGAHKLAKHCRMSVGKVGDAKKELVKAG